MSAVVPNVIFQRDGLGVAQLGNIVIGLWTGELKEEQVRACLMGYHHAVRYGPVLSLNVCESVSPRFPEPVRRAITDLAETTRENSKATCILLPDPGFVAATVRAFISGLALVTSEPTRICANYQEVQRWLAQMSPERSAEELMGRCHETLQLLRG